MKLELVGVDFFIVENAQFLVLYIASPVCYSVSKVHETFTRVLPIYHYPESIRMNIHNIIITLKISVVRMLHEAIKHVIVSYTESCSHRRRVVQTVAQKVELKHFTF